ncbi:transporter suffix domain-containing protein [bacterium]|nr:transporter suffix domain-containing protein [bacterium]
MSAKPWAFRLGIGLMILSCGLWVALLVVPFLPLATSHKAALGGAVVVGAEVLFWVGGLIAGPEAITRFRSFFGRKPRQEKTPE